MVVAGGYQLADRLAAQGGVTQRLGLAADAVAASVPA